MKPIAFDGHNTVFGLGQTEYDPLPAYRVSGFVICCWTLSFWERLRVLFGANIWHEMIVGNGDLQPQYLSTQRSDWIGSGQ